jgi:hypothetical protein
MLDLNKSCVYANGVVDMNATLHKVAQAIESYNESKLHDMVAVEAAVNEVFTKYKGTFVNVKALGTLVVGILKPNGLDAITVLTDRVDEYIKANSGEGGTFEVRKGRGVARIADLSEKDAKKA